MPAQEEVTSKIARYREREMSTGYYEDYEVKPRSYKPYVQSPEAPKGVLGLGPNAEKVRKRTYLQDSHWGVNFYAQRSCTECHTASAANSHVTRAKITCRQCHGGEPIASLGNIPYSPMNPIRRHAYVCAKCHEGAGASFATYVIHAPHPGSPQKPARPSPRFIMSFGLWWPWPSGPLPFSIPHTFLWGIKGVFNQGERKWRPEIAKNRIKRFSAVQRWFHLLLLVFFLIQGSTGLARMYIETGWGQSPAACFGGYENALTVHIWVGIFLLLLFIGHLVLSIPESRLEKPAPASK